MSNKVECYCGSEMKYTGREKTIYPVLYVYKCNKCGEEKNIDYHDHVKYLEIENKQLINILQLAKQIKKYQKMAMESSISFEELTNIMQVFNIADNKLTKSQIKEALANLAKKEF